MEEKTKNHSFAKQQNKNKKQKNNRKQQSVWIDMQV